MGKNKTRTKSKTRIPREKNGGVDRVLRFYHGRTKKVDNGVKGCEMGKGKATIEGV
jgi:hypothetical protein